MCDMLVMYLVGCVKSKISWNIVNHCVIEWNTKREALHASILNRLLINYEMIAHQLRNDCASIAHQLHIDCTSIAYRFCIDCEIIEPRLLSDCSATAYHFYRDKK
jgi:hypothetical protein